jgi:homoserine kinase type II
MADYTQLTVDEIQSVLSSYDLGRLESILPLQGGQANSSFKITTASGQFILSVCDEKNFYEIDNLTQTLSYLAINNFPTNRVIRTRDGSYFVNRYDKPIYVKQFIHGNIVKTLSPEMLIQVGQAMAALHAILPLDTMPDRFPYGIHQFDELFELDMQHPYIEWLKRKEAYLKSAIDSDMAKGLIHGDIFWDNLLFENDKLVGVLDFEEVCHYYRLFDIGMCAVGCCGNHGILDVKQAASLLQGYQRHYRLSPHEKRQLKVFMEYAATAGSFWRFRQYTIKYPLKEMADSYQELSSIADYIHSMPENVFINSLQKG